MQGTAQNGFGHTCFDMFERFERFVKRDEMVPEPPKIHEPEPITKPLIVKPPTTKPTGGFRRNIPLGPLRPVLQLTVTSIIADINYEETLPKGMEVDKSIKVRPQEYEGKNKKELMRIAKQLRIMHDSKDKEMNKLRNIIDELQKRLSDQLAGAGNDIEFLIQRAYK